MLSFFKKLFTTPGTDLTQLLQNGAVVVDVRTRQEYAGGHVKGSLNIPLDEIGQQSQKLRKYPHIIVCCRSGNRSSMAERQLRAKGISNVTNGGSWQNVNQYIK